MLHISTSVFTLQLRCCRQDSDHDNKLGQLESQTKIASNGDVHHDSQNVHNNSNSRAKNK